jgi:hypothetical protein
MELLLSVISLALAVYERMERTMERRRIRHNQIVASKAPQAPFVCLGAAPW